VNIPQVKAKPLNLSSKPLKSFNWQKLPVAKIKETIWSNIDDDEIHKSLKGSAYSEFEDLFAAKEVKTEIQASSTDLQRKYLNLLSF
jgi:dishevelled associated activator of morphogenesis